MITLPLLIDELADTAPNKTALVDRGQTINYEDLASNSRKIASGLQRYGIEKGDRVGVWLPNIAAYIEFFLACAEIGAIVVSLNTKFKSFEMADIVSRSNCKMLVLWPSFKDIPFLDILSEIPAGGMDSLEIVVFYTEEGDAKPILPNCLKDKNVLDFDVLRLERDITWSRPKEDDGLLIFTTSGTTGKPKFVLHSQRSITQHAGEVAVFFEYGQRECRLFQANPLCGTFGLTQAIAGLAAKAEIYCLPVFNAKDAVRILQKNKITDMNGSDDMFALLLDQADEEIPFPSLKTGGFAAFNPAQNDIVERAETRGIRLTGLWGMSELQAFFSRQDPAAPANERKLAGGYLTSPLAKVRIVDPQSRRILDFGEQGEIEICGPSQMKEYFVNPQATKEAFTDDGFIRTGDLGYQTKPDHFVFVARMGDALRLGGFLTDPVEIESCLQHSRGISKAQVVGVDTKNGIRAFAFISVEEGATPDLVEAMDYCKNKLAHYKVPIHIQVIKGFPMTESANGMKIQRGKLRQQAQELWTKII